MLTTLIGPIEGINLRNLLWHGFLKPKEFEKHYTSFLLLVILSLDKVIETLINEEAKRRPLTVSKLKKIKLIYLSILEWKSI